MNSLRRWLYRPKRSDPSLLAQFYFADEELNLVAAELDSFEGRKDPERCTALVNQLRACQARVLNVVSQMMDECVKDQRAPRDFRVKFPDDVIQENLAGQLWFGAECLAAGSSIMNREIESACMRPLARALTKNLDSLRSILREQCLRNVHEYTETIKESLVIFDKLFAEFELSYVSAMVPVKTAHEYDMVQEITVLFSETVQRALKTGLLTVDMIDEYDPALMFTIPRLAIVSGVVIFNDGPLNPDNDPWNISEMFRPFQTLLLKIRELLGILTEEELNTLERALCSQEEPSFLISLEEKKKQNSREERRKSKEEKKPKVTASKDKKNESEGDDGSVESELTALEIAERLEALALNFEASRNIKHSQTSTHQDADAESKSSESSSTSSSSLLSEAETDDGCAAEIPKENASEQPEESQVQRFTNQLYYEANLDSHDMTQEAALIGPLNAFSSETIFITPQSPNVASGGNADGDASENDTVSDRVSAQGENEEEAKYEDAARAHFAMNKCDSNDSGLHSEVISNSGSMFTISSSDSNQLLGSFDAPATSENVESNQSDRLASESHREHDHLDNKDSTSTLVPSSETSGNDRMCFETGSALNDQDADERGAGAANDGDDIMVSPMEEQAKLVDRVNNLKPFDTPCGTESSSCLSSQAATASASPEICKKDLSCKCTGYGTSPSLTSLHNCCESCSKEDLNDSPNKITLTKCDVENAEGGCGPSTDASAGEHVAVSIDDNGKVDSLSTGSDIKTCTVPQELAHSSTSEYGKSKLEHSQCDICDTNVPKDMEGGDSLNEMNVNNVVGATAKDNAIEPHGGATDTASASAKEGIQTSSKETGYAEMPENLVSKDNEQRSGADDKAGELCKGNEPTHLKGREDMVKSLEPEVRVVSNSAVSPTNATSAAQSIATASPFSSSSPSPTNMQTESQEKSKCPPTSTQREMQNHSSMPIACSSSHATSSATSARACLKDTKGASTTKASSKKSSKTRSSQSDKRQGGDTRSSMPSRAKALMDSHLMDSEYCNSSETSSYNSDCGDQEEIALAIKAAESATRHQVRARFRSSSDMIHRLFVCISGVADQLQTNFAGDLRNILRAVFDMNCSEPIDINDNDKSKDTTPLRAAYRAMSNSSRSARRARHSTNQRQEPPSWLPDEQSNECMSCQVPFTFVRRRHHCRNCGKIFCSRCSSNFVPLPHFGQDRAVRVCNRCFMFKVTPFTVRPRSQ